MKKILEFAKYLTCGKENVLLDIIKEWKIKVIKRNKISKNRVTGKQKPPVRNYTGKEIQRPVDGETDMRLGETDSETDTHTERETDRQIIC